MIEARSDAADSTDTSEFGESPDTVSEAYARRVNLIVSVTLAVVGAGAGVLSWRLDIGSADEPGPGMWPLIVSVAMVALAIAQFARPTPSGGEERFSAEGSLVAIGAVSLVAYAALFERIGFEVPSLALLVLWIRVLGRESWLTTLSVAAGGVVALYLIFITALGVSIPHLV